MEQISFLENAFGKKNSILDNYLEINDILIDNVDLTEILKNNNLQKILKIYHHIYT